MPNRSRLSKAYGKRGKAQTKYKASLYDIEALGYEKEASRAGYEFDTAKTDRNLALISEGIGLTSDVVGGAMSKKQLGKDKATIQEGMAKKAYKGETAWGELGTKEKATELAKFEPDTVKQDFSEWVFGAEKEYTFGGGKEKFSKSQVTAAAGIYGSDRLSELVGIDTDSKVLENIKGIQSSESSESNVKSKPDAVLPPITVDEIISGNTKKVDAVDLSSEEGSKKIIQDIQAGVNNIGKTEVKKVPTLQDITDDSDEEPWSPNIPGMNYGSAMGAGSTRGVKKFAKGGEFTTDGPEMILVGDNPGGKEKVTVKPIKSKKKEKSEGSNSLSDNLGGKLQDLVSKKGTKPGSNKWMNNYIQSQKINNQSLRPLQGELSKHNNKLFSMAEESGYFGEFFRGGWE
tara:strand:- start:2477 stop:3682 length:1206 start_codon:yes stop_codon:yes gene_type:complete